jgi:predicted nuclease of restriction endonuclease-like (RecB) superfamily
MSKSDLIPEDSYRELLESLKGRIRSSQIKAAIAVNHEMIRLYWQIGKEILSRLQAEKPRAMVVKRLAQDLKAEFPGMKGFSVRNLTYMRTFANAYPDIESSAQQVVASIPWGHNCALLDKVEAPEERIWYAHKIVEHGWSRAILLAQIETNLYQQQEGIINNFDRTLPPPQSEMAAEVLRDPYHFDFLTIAEDAKVQDIKTALVKHMRDFLLELGIGFSFVRANYNFDIGGRDYFVDLLFYHIRLRCYVVIQLEMGEFQPEQSGLMNFYLSAIDERERIEGDNPSIGIILCKTKDRTTAEYSLRNLSNPIAVAEHRLPKSELPEVLPSPEKLESELENAAKEIKGEQES